MGFLRGLGKFLGSLIFTTFLALVIVLMGIVAITSHDSIKQTASDILEKQLLYTTAEVNLEDVRNFLLFQCTQSSKTTLTLSGNLPQVILDCNDVRNSDSSKLPRLIAESLVDSIYYKNFGCNFSNLYECVTKPENVIGGVTPENVVIVPLFFLSNEGNQFNMTAAIYSIVIAVVGLGILFASIENWVGRLQGLGWNLVITSLPILVLNKVQSFVPAGSPETADAVKPLIDSFISSTTKLFMIALVVGIICLIAGYGMKFYQSKKQNKRKR